MSNLVLWCYYFLMSQHSTCKLPFPTLFILLWRWHIQNRRTTLVAMLLESLQVYFVCLLALLLCSGSLYAEVISLTVRVAG